MSEEKKIDALVRCFIAIELPREVIGYIRELQNLIRKKNFFAGKFTEPENLHLTLKFLGEIEEGKLEEIKRKLSGIRMLAFNTSLGEVGVFSERMLRILWIKINGKSILDLQIEIDKALEELFPKEERFMSHLTIARMKKVYDKKEFLDYIKNIKTKKIKFKVNEFILKKSELRPEGPVYSDIEKYKLD